MAQSFNFTAPNDYDIQARTIERRRKMAEMLQQQAMTPLEPNRMAGGYVVPISPMEGIAKLAQAWASGQSQRAADKELRGLGEQMAADRAETFRRAIEAGQGAPIIPQPSDELGGGPGRPEGPANRRAMYQVLAGAKDPGLAQMGMAGMLKDFDEPTRIDLGDRIGLYRNGVLVGAIPKGATPDAQLRETGANARHQTPTGTAILNERGSMERHLTPSGSAILSEQGQNQRHLTPSGSSQLSANVTMRGQNMTDARARETNDIQRQAARVQIVNDPVQGPLLVDKGSGTTTPARFANGQPVPGEIPAKAQANSRDVQMLLKEAQNSITNATGSYTGAGIDQLMRVFGAATDGSIAIANLKAIEGALLSKMPRMEGPQSNYDVHAYRQAVGEIGDPTVPNRQKAAAVETVKQIQLKYSSNLGQTSGGGASGGWSGGVPSTADIDAELARRAR